MSVPDAITPNYAVQITEDVQATIMEVFAKLPLSDKCLIYARYKHGNAFKPELSDLFGLSKHKATIAISGFLRAVNEGL